MINPVITVKASPPRQIMWCLAPKVAQMLSGIWYPPACCAIRPRETSSQAVAAASVLTLYDSGNTPNCHAPNPSDAYGQTSTATPSQGTKLKNCKTGWTATYPARRYESTAASVTMRKSGASC